VKDRSIGVRCFSTVERSRDWIFFGSVWEKNLMTSPSEKNWLDLLQFGSSHDCCNLLIIEHPQKPF
jgi:hypothetical protein